MFCLFERQLEMQAGSGCNSNILHPAMSTETFPITPSTRGKDNIFFCRFHLKNQKKAVSWKKASFRRRHASAFSAKIIQGATVRRYNIARKSSIGRWNSVERKLRNSSSKYTNIISLVIAGKQKGAQEKKKPKSSYSFHNYFSSGSFAASH